MNDDARLKSIVKIKTDIQMVNYELDEELYRQMGRMMKNDMKPCLCL
jgi:hypothetical protein